MSWQKWVALPTLVCFFVGCGGRTEPINEDGPVTDGAVDHTAVGDMPGPERGWPWDGPPPITDAQPADGAGPCAAATPITLSGGKGQVTGTIHQTDTDNDVVLPATSCAKAATVGVDRFYSLKLVPGKAYTITLDTSGSPLQAAVYVFASCSNVAGTCVGGAVTGAAGKVAQITTIAGNIGSYSIAVDSTAAPGTTGGYGDYTLTVEEMSNSDTCIGAPTLTWSSGTASVTDDTSTASNTLDLSYTSCTQAPTPGPDRFYAVQLTAGQAYKVTVTPTGKWDPTLYVLGSCGNPTGNCLAGGSSAYAGAPEVVKLTPKTTGTYFIGVDSSDPAGYPGSGGPFTLTVEPFTAPTNDGCAAAEVLTWSGGKASASGDTTLAIDDVNLSTPYPGACMLKATPGPDLFYSVSVTGGKSYKVTVTPTSPWPVAAYVFESCANPGGTCLAGMDYGPPTGTTLVFNASKTGAVLVGVDSSGMPGAGGPFTLVVEEFVPPTNDGCAAAQPLTWSAGKASASGDTSLGTNTLDLTASSPACSIGGTPGKDLFYSLTVSAGKAYKVTVSSPSGPVPWPAVAYVLGGCANPSGACVAAGMGNALTFVAATTGTVVIGVDSFASDPFAAGPFTLTAEEFIPPQNDVCAQATALTFSAGLAAAAGDTSLASNAVNMAYPNSCNAPTAPGPDLFYSVVVNAGKGYKVTVTPTGSTFWSPVAYAFTSCTNPEGTCLGGGYAGPGGATFNFKAASNGSVLIVVDSASSGSYDVGPFALTVQEYTAPANDSCAQATALTWNSGLATATGDTAVASNEVDMTYPNSCNLKGAPGADLFYSVSVTAAKSYTVTVVPSGSFPWSPVAYAFTSCTNPEGTCLAGGYPGGPGSSFSFTAAATGTVLIAVDTPSPSTSGPFTLLVQ